MILVLLYKFSESQESLLGYQLCQKLVKEGHHLYVTTTSTKGGWLTKEIQNAKKITEKSKGSITLLEPKYHELEEPSPEWIANLHKHYFGYLSELQDIETIIGTLPGTIQTAVDLKEVLKCQLVLLATTKISEDQEELKKEVNCLVKHADEIWSVGLDMHSQYQNVLHELDTTTNDKHQEILLQPTTKSIKYWEYNATRVKSHRTGIRKLVSVWNNPYPFFHKGKKVYSKGSSIKSFYTLCCVLGEINAQAIIQQKSKLQWNVHGLKFQDQVIKSIEEKAKPNVVQITALSSVNSVDDLTWKNCLAFIVPEIVDETFNFVALSALWLGIPTIVSSQSSVGRFLLELTCPEKTRAVITLTGDPKTDKETWKEKIHREILNEEARPMEWAKTLSEFLHSNTKLWELDLFASLHAKVKSTGQRRLSTDSAVSHSSYVTAVEPRTDVASAIDKVANWSLSLSSAEQTIPKRVETRHPWSGSQVAGSRNLTPSSASSVSIPYPPPGKPEFRMCLRHTGFPLNLFCEQCNIPICSDCYHTSHRNHKTVPLIQKSKELTENLRSVLVACHRQEKEIERRSSTMNRCSQDIEETTAIAVRQMEEEYKQITAEIGRVYNEQVDVINKAKRDEQSRFETEVALLQNMNKHRKDIEETSRQLLEHTASPDFISRSITFLSYNQLKKLPEDRQKIWKRWLYRHPSYKQTLDPEQFREYVQHHILGYFAPDRPGQFMSDNTHPTQGHLTRQGSIQSLYSVGASSHATAWSGTSRLSYISTVSGFPALDEQAEFLTQTSTKAVKKTAELVSYVALEKFEGSHLKIFSSAFFSREAMWICGWNKGGIFAKPDTVLLNVEVPDYKTILKQKKSDPNAELPTIMIPFRDGILFAKKSGSEIYSFKYQSNQSKFKRVLGGADLTVAAMCSSNERVFILNPKQADYIRVLDSRFQAEGKIQTGLGDVRGCDIDISLIGEHPHSVPSTPSSAPSRVSSPVDHIHFGFQSPAEFHRSSSFREKHSIDHTIVISTSSPHASLRAVNQIEGVVWQVDSRTNPELGLEFNPCSVSASETGDIYFADSSNDKIYTVSTDGKNLQVVLDRRKAIRKPTRVRVDREGKRLVVINKEGREIRNYTLEVV